MTLREFIEKNEVEYTKNLVTSDDVIEIGKELEVTFGSELTQYILTYGYLAYKHIELYGINSKQNKDSDMVKQTKYLHQYFTKTEGFIALENTGDGDYIVVGPDDDVYEFSSDENRISEVGSKLFDYILKRFKEIDI